MTRDASARREALNPAESFLVQAPAGSGKTELLVQRFLRLLSVVDAPEEVVALTFTRKAAAQMRARISGALVAARDQVPAESAHGQKTLELAQAALERDREKHWELCRHPSRLRVQTLDSLCASITRQMPMLSAFGAQPGISEDARELYLQAAQNTLAELERGHHWSNSIDRLLSHLNNDLERVAELLAQMLARRDQWLRFVASRHDPRRQRENLEAALTALVETALAAAQAAFPNEETTELGQIARYAAQHLPVAEDEASAIASLGELNALPPAKLAALAQWRGISELLLTKEGDWRKRVNVNQGFPPDSAANSAVEKARFAEMKTRFAELKQRLETQEALRRSLAGIPKLPEGAYSQTQWQILQALFEMLQLAAANLQLVFRDRGSVDFIEMAARAGQALGGADKPTDLALALDYRLRHLLVDEFQDTSVSQFRLLEQLVAGWQPGDGRSLFLVGDPMQSIYRFRQAEVGLYLQVRDSGLGGVPLTFCRLSANFRSQPGVIDWINQVFPAVMPAVEEENPAAGAISYTPAQAQRPAGAGGVHLHGFLEQNQAAEAGRVAELVSAARHERADASIAILVRSRRHVAHLLPQLKAWGLLFQAVEIEALGQRPVVQDLLALTRCLLHPADRLSWLAVLRAPWCGLCLSDLLHIAGENKRSSIHQRLADASVRQGLSAHGLRAANRIHQVLQDSLADRGRRSLRRWVEGTWLALGGPAAVTAASALEEAQVYFGLLDNLDEGGDLADLGRLAQQVEGLFAPPDPQADPGLQIMTIHRAKGLEFDVVVVPGLGRRSANQSQPLLFWLELPRLSEHVEDESDLLLAPIAAAGERDEPIYKYLKSLDKVKEGFEQGRLLYVAATRARDTLHLLGHIPLGKDGPGTPVSGSLLERLWPGVAPQFMAVLEESDHEPEPVSQAPLMLRRLPAEWQLPETPPSVAPGGQALSEGPEVSDELAVEYFWAGPGVRHIGTVVHQVLMQIGRSGTSGWDAARIDALQPMIAARLTALGIAPARVGKRAIRVITALKNTLADSRGRWLLQVHEEGVCEYALTGLHEGELVNVIIDRSFLDEHNQRWIIDYKTGGHEGGDSEKFMDQEHARYAPQLERYAALMAQTEDRPIRLGLYFPMLGGWREWPAGEQ